MIAHPLPAQSGTRYCSCASTRSKSGAKRSNRQATYAPSARGGRRLQADGGEHVRYDRIRRSCFSRLAASSAAALNFAQAAAHHRQVLQAVHRSSSSRARDSQSCEPVRSRLWRYRRLRDESRPTVRGCGV